MFDFSQLNLVVSTRAQPISSSFVGIRKAAKGGFEFALPRGFGDFPKKDFEKTKSLFFRMYKTFKVFEKSSNSVLKDYQPRGKDNTKKGGGAYCFEGANGEDVILYSKIDLIDDFFRIFEDLSLDIMRVYQGRSEEIDYSKIEFHMDKCVYLNNDVIFFDEIIADRNIISYGINDLITMFAFILSELKKELEEDVDGVVGELSKDFTAKHLTLDQRLFDEFGFNSTVMTLKDILHKIDKEEAYKDERYWAIFTVVENFLYGSLNPECSEDGIFWGISNFWKVWEDMCNTYFILESMKNKDEVFFADTTVVINGVSFNNSLLNHQPVFIRSNWRTPFFVEFRGFKRYLRPDLVIQNNIESVFNGFVGVKIKKEYSRSIMIGVREKFVDLEITSKGVSEQQSFFEYFVSELTKKVKNSSRFERINKQVVVFYAYPYAKYEEVKTASLDFIERKKGSCFIIDWKYVDESFFEEERSRMKEAFIKQMCYESCLESSTGIRNKFIKNQMGYPFYSKDKKDVRPFIPVQNCELNLPTYLCKGGIDLFRVNFLMMQEVYLKNAKS